MICNPDKLTDKGCDGAGVWEYWIVDPMKQKILVYYFEESAFDVRQYTFQDGIKVNIFEDLSIDFKELGL